MSNDKLAVIHPHRDGPDDINYRTTKEYAFCTWCRFHSHELGSDWEPASAVLSPAGQDEQGRYVEGHNYWGPNLYYHACSNRKVIDLHPQTPERIMHCSKFNRDGSCAFFEPSRLTRFLRALHFGRSPVFRSQGDRL